MKEDQNRFDGSHSKAANRMESSETSQSSSVDQQPIDVNRNQMKPARRHLPREIQSKGPENAYNTDLEHGFTHSIRSQRSCCSEHDPPPHWFSAGLPPTVLHLLGTFLALLAGFFLTVGGLLISKIQTLQPLEISGLRSLVACAYLLPIIVYFRPKHDFGWSVMLETIGISLIFCVKFVTFSIGSTLLPLSEFSLLCNTVPVFTAFFGCLFLAETCGIREWLSCSVVTLGVLATFVPNFIDASPANTGSTAMTQETNGYIVTILSAMSNAIALCWLRRLKEVHSLLISFYACIVTAIVSMAASYFSDELVKPTSGDDMVLVCGAAFCMLVQALLPAIACTLTQASRVAVAMTFSVVASFILQVFFQGKEPTIYAIAGGVLIIFAMVIGNLPCGTTDDDTVDKEDRFVDPNASHYGSMSAALDSSPR